MINKSMFKKLLISFLLAVFLLTSASVSYAKADVGPWYNQSFEEWSAKVFDDGNPQEIFGERYTYAQVTWILHSLEAYTLGEDLIRCVNSSNDQSELKSCIEAVKETGSSLGPAMAIASVGDSLLTTPPVSGVEYVAVAASKLHIIPEAYAQGIGFKTFQPAQAAWRVSRNMTYALLIVAVIAMAFMIMFRVKISPQTIITIQSALPRLILILILITLSYAIAGFIVDLSYLILATVSALVNSAGQITDLGTIEFFTQLVFGNLFWAFAAISIIHLAIVVFGGAIIGGGVGAYVGGPTALAGAATGAILTGVIIFLVIIVIMIIASIRILWLLTKTTVNILLLVIAAPIMILSGVVPATGGFGVWLRNFAANVAVFPMVKLMLLLAHYFYWGLVATELNLLAESSFLNPLKISPLGGEPTDLSAFIPINRVTGGITGWIISFGIFLLIPSAGNIIKSIIQGQPFAYGTAIGEAFGPARTTAVGAGIMGAERLYGKLTGKDAWAARPGTARRGIVEGLYTAVRGGLERVGRGK